MAAEDREPRGRTPVLDRRPGREAAEVAAVEEAAVGEEGAAADPVAWANSEWGAAATAGVPEEEDREEVDPQGEGEVVVAAVERT